MTVAYTILSSPLGPILIAGTGAGLLCVSFMEGASPSAPQRHWLRDDAALGNAREQLKAYFNGQLRNFHLDLAPSGTAFQLKVWKALTAIPYGHTITYGELARRIGQGGAARAVGGANARNPLAIVVPCHRVVAARGALGGFSAGLHVKRALLDLEAGHPAHGTAPSPVAPPAPGR